MRLTPGACAQHNSNQILICLEEKDESAERIVRREEESSFPQRSLLSVLVPVTARAPPCLVPVEHKEAFKQQGLGVSGSSAASCRVPDHDRLCRAFLIRARPWPRSDVASGSSSDAAHADVDERRKQPRLFPQSIVVVWPLINGAQRIPGNRKHTDGPPADGISKLTGQFVNERDRDPAACSNFMGATSQPREDRKIFWVCL